MKAFREQLLGKRFKLPDGFNRAKLRPCVPTLTPLQAFTQPCEHTMLAIMGAPTQQKEPVKGTQTREVTSLLGSKEDGRR